MCSTPLPSAAASRIGRWRSRQLGYFLLTDPQFAEAERKVESGEKVGFAWYMGMGLAIYVPWVIESGLGAMFGKLIPDTHALGIDFLLPIYFLGLVMGFRKRPMWLPVVVVSAIVSVIAYRTIGSPWHVSVGAAAGILLAAAMPVRARQHSIVQDIEQEVRQEADSEHDAVDHPVGRRLTYLTRIGGHLVLSRFERIHPRVEAGLNAVPAAVLTTLVAPAAVSAGPVELLALFVAGLVSLRAGLLAMFLTGAAVLIAGRQLIG